MTEHIDYPQAVIEKQRLIAKLNRGLFVNEEWVSLIVLLAMTGWIAMADDLDQRRKVYNGEASEDRWNAEEVNFSLPLMQEAV